MNAALLHCIAHVAASAARIKRNNEAAKSGDIDAEPPRDQGFTRAKVGRACLVGAGCTGI